MSGQKLFQKTILAGVMAFALGLGACSTTNYDNEEWLGDEDFAFAETDMEAFPAENKELPMEDIVPCHPGDEGCVASDEYLTDTFIQTEFKDEETTSAEEPLFTEVTSTEDVIALSRPAGSNAVAVKDKKAPPAQSTADKVLYSTKAFPETVKKTDEHSFENKKISENKKIIENKEIAENKEANENKETKVVVGTEVGQSGAEQGWQDAVSVPGQMMPLKKVTTTITETTTKVKKDPTLQSKTEHDFNSMTLKEKVAYGEADQEWVADVGNTLRGLLMEWGKRSGWTVVWKLDRDYRLEAGVVFQGTFTDVSGALIRSFARATPAPIGTFYQGNRVLVVSTQEDENER